MKKNLFLLALLLGIVPFAGRAQNIDLAEKLGLPKDAKLLIIHADDIGMAHSVNRASITAFERKGITSGSIMVPCPWFPEIAEYARQHPDFDWGLHLTFTAEWKNFRWGGLSPANEIPSLLDSNGFFYASAEEFTAKAKLPEVEKELRAQIERAIAFGLKPSHLDSHMGTLFQSPALFEIYLRVGREYGMPVLIPLNFATAMPEFMKLIKPEDVAVNQLFMIDENVKPKDWTAKYTEFIGQMKPGLNEIIIHAGHDDAELQAVCIEHPAFGSAWRQRDFEAVLSPKFMAKLKKENIFLVKWKDIQALNRD